MKYFSEPSEVALDLSAFSTQFIHQAVMRLAGEAGWAVAAWRKGGEPTQHIIIDTSGKAKRPTLELENLPPGFMLSPFTHDYQGTDERPYFIQADLHYQNRTHEFNPLAMNKADRLRLPLFNQMMKEALLNPEPLHKSANRVSAGVKPDLAQDKDSFISMVKAAREAISQAKFKKVVPSRCRYVSLPDDFNITESFQKLCRAYPNAFVSLVSVPGLGTWLGASPEVLVSTFVDQGQHIFKTVALAGTQALSHPEDIQNAAWRSKEIEEQAMVSRYIINCFKKIRLREFEEDGPRTIAAGNLMHLQTDFLVNMDAVRFPELGSVMLRLLHPTSAVCGLPKEPALRFLQQHEGYDRSLYSGFLGPVNIQDELSIYVNLRCMQFSGEGAILYAGAGVTADSQPEKEWLETEMKMKTLEQILLK
ncbi:MAG: chorismate-binding protein [Cyclobacteriaceae bacterium]